MQAWPVSIYKISGVYVCWSPLCLPRQDRSELPKESRLGFDPDVVVIQHVAKSDVLIEKTAGYFHRNQPGRMVQRQRYRHADRVRIHDTNVLRYYCTTRFPSWLYCGVSLRRLGGTLAFKIEAVTVADEELHRAILVTQNRFSEVMKTDDWVNHVRSE